MEGVKATYTACEAYAICHLRGSLNTVLRAAGCIESNNISILACHGNFRSP